jgi:hypothetical protein
MKLAFLSAALGTLILSTSCLSTEQGNTPSNGGKDSVALDTWEDPQEDALTEAETKAYVEDIDAYRQEVEGMKDALRLVELLRIKSYPHADVSKRTEEFYFRNGQLVLAVIEDDGSGPAGETSDDSKRYYFKEGRAVMELYASGEAEYSIRDSDAERLLQETREYAAVLEQQQQQARP